MNLQERDINLLAYIHKFQCLTTPQISKLFGWNIKAVQRRLRILCAGGFLNKMAIPTVASGKPPYLFYLGDTGATFLHVAPSKPKLTLKLSHQQKNSDLLIDVILSFKSLNIQCAIIPEHLIRTTKQQKSIIPDGGFMLKREDKTALFLLENCGGTEILSSPTSNMDIESKITRYKDVFQNNAIELFSNYFNSDFTRFRVLFLANSVKRLDSVSKLVIKNDDHGFIWLSTLSDFKKKGVCGNIYYIPATNKFEQSII